MKSDYEDVRRMEITDGQGWLKPLLPKNHIIEQIDTLENRKIVLKKKKTEIRYFRPSGSGEKLL